MRVDISYKELLKQIKSYKKLSKLAVAQSNEIKEPMSLTNSINVLNDNFKEAAPKKMNKIEQAREELIEWIADCNLSLNIVDKKKNKEHPQSNTNFYIIGRVLGRGAFGKANLCIHKLTEKLVAIKSLNKEYFKSNKTKLNNEINILKALKHKNIVRLYETFTNDQYLLIVNELCEGGDLLNYVRKRRKLTEPIAKLVFKQILDGINHCHSKGIVHRDIKLDNILLNSYGDIKVSVGLIVDM